VATPSGAVNVSLQWQQMADPRNGFVFKAWQTACRVMPRRLAIRASVQPRARSWEMRRRWIRFGLLPLATRRTLILRRAIAQQIHGGITVIAAAPVLN
jgi:hypothetical protein